MVRPQRDALTVNIADALQFMTSGFSTSPTYRLGLTLDATDGYLKLSIHRVVAPPPVQAHINRLGVLYMVRIEDDTNLVPVQESPVLQRLGLLENKTVDSDGKPVKARKWVRQRVVKNLGATSTAGRQRGD
jgi:isopenicillin N synthase-like dioxygenase